MIGKGIVDRKSSEKRGVAFSGFSKSDPITNFQRFRSYSIVNSHDTQESLVFEEAEMPLRPLLKVSDPR